MSPDRLSPLDALVPPHRGPRVPHAHRLGRRSSRGRRRPYDDMLAMVAGQLDSSRSSARRSATSPSSSGARSGWTTLTSTSSTTCVTPHCRHRGDAELRQLIGRVMAQQLDRSKPLWEIWVVEGLEDGRWAMLSKSTTPWSTGCRERTCSPSSST